ncbi:hypothetical protein A2U01_0044197, partial [Trifolium medium]|nr:hypothetical protein [Trifolium medium]
SGSLPIAQGVGHYCAGRKCAFPVLDYRLHLACSAGSIRRGAIV